MISLQKINEFIEAQPIALVGASRDPKKFGHAAFKELKEKGMNIIPVNPHTDQIIGEKTYPDVSSLPPDVKGLIIVTKKAQAVSVIKEAKKRGIKQIWIQQMADSKEALDELRDTDINYISGKCILMFYKPNGIHKFHGKFLKFFGRFPR